MLYVNNEYVITDIYLNDGFWHYICASWSDFEGRYAIYVDGNLTQSNVGLSTGKQIQGACCSIIFVSIVPKIILSMQD